MSIIYILIPIAVLLTSLGIYLFFWAVKTEQFDDLEKQGLSIFFDDDASNTTSSSESAVSISPEIKSENIAAKVNDKLTNPDKNKAEH